MTEGKRKRTYKLVPFRTEQVELCINCHGTGRVAGDDGHTTPCPICGGSGRVRRITEGTVTIEPYEDDNSDRF